ncbi:MAG: TetR/AcrR family transcriptional regulator [Tenericutes bacterium]|jgi:AcrR family transcriptional regulator|nr:TetR/AcrR family transcriptional regulator [Mycoplasmatota bacterium]
MNKDKTQLLTENKNLFEESINEFSAKPYDMASVNEIIKRSQYNKGSFYYRFKDKNELYISLLDYVFVQQVDLFKKSGFSLLTSNNPREVLVSLFQNLIDLYHFDKRYYNIVRLLYNEEDDFILQTLGDSVGSLYERFKLKLKKMTEVNDSQMIIIESLYKNLPVLSIINSKITIQSIVDQVINGSKNMASEQETDNSDLITLIEKSIEERFNYIVLDEKYDDFDKRWFDIIKVSQNIKFLKNRLKFKIFRLKLNIKSILNRYKHKPIFNYLAIENLLKSDLYPKIVKDKVLSNITYGLIYAIIDLREYILINQSLKFLNEEQRDILFNYILPLNGKLSKIIFMDQSIILNNNNIAYFYYYNEFSGIKKLHVDGFKDKYYLKIHCHYKINDQFYHVYYNSFQSFLRFYQDNEINIIKLESTHELHLGDLREVVED